MSRVLSSQFLTGPLEFARLHVLALTEARSEVVDVRATHYVRNFPEEQESLTYSKVSAADRVAYADIEVGPAAAGFQGAHLVRISKQHAAGHFPIFWLPYRQNDTRKMTLKDKRDPAVARREGGEPRIFFTSALNGCTVFIEGSLEQPTVTHANAGNFRVTQGPIDDTKTHDDRIGRTLELERRIKLVPPPTSVRNPGKSVGQTLSPSGVLHGHNYLPNYFRDNQAKLTNIDAAYVNGALALLGIAPPAVQSTTVDHTALVFGFKSRTTEQWEFWVQQRARVSVRTAGGQQSCYVGRKIKQFWPGNKYVHVRGNTPYNAIVLRNV